MSEEPDNLVLRYLRRIDERLERVADDFADLKRRLTIVAESVAGQNLRLDRIDRRLERVERRLELIDLPVT
jgi:archaellum component FlaC